MANPLKILTVLTASEAAQFKKAVQVETGGLTVSAGNTVVQDLTASNISASGDMTMRDAVLRNANLSGDAYLQNAYLTNAYLSGAATFVDGVSFNSITSSIKTLITNEASARVAGDLAVAATASANLNTVSGALKAYVDSRDTTISGALKTYIDAQDAADAIAWAAADSALSGAMKAYVDAQDTANSSSMKAYVDAQDTALSGAFDTRIVALSGATKSYVDAQDSALSGALKTYVDAQDTALSGAFDTRITNLSGAVKSYVDAQDNALSGAFDTRMTALSGAVSSSIAGEAAARAAEDLTFLKLDGSRAMTAALNMGGFDITSAKSGSFSGDVSVAGNLQVNGALTYVNSTELQVTDKLITIAKGAANAAAANGGGIELEGAGASLTYASTGDKWVSNKSLEVASDLFISGATDFSYIPVSRVSGKYDVDAAIQALDVAVSGAVAAGGSDVANVKASYDALRQVVTGTLSSGTALLTLAGTQFAAGEIDNLALDVMIDADNTGYTNDLVAIKMFVDGAAVKVQIDAPAAASAKYRLIVVNEKDGGLDVI